MNKKQIPIFIFAALIISIAITCICCRHDTSSADVYDYNFNLSVHYIDVGQADSFLISLPNGEHMLIDAGNNSDGDKVVDYLLNHGVTRIDYLIGTHPHSDHIGGLDTVISKMDIGKFYMPNIMHDTKTFEDVLDAADKKGLLINTAKNGVRIYSDAETSVDIIAPVGDKYESLNNYSAVILLKYRDSSFLFTGDAETESESEITASLNADVLKVGHHGSSTSSGKSFLNKVRPTYAVISCGKDNSYGHPHKETIDSLNNMNVKIYRTDINGSIICRTDGEKYYWECEKN